LPEGWQEVKDNYGKIYYWHEKTQHSTWEHPGNMVPIPVQPE